MMQRSRHHLDAARVGRVALLLLLWPLVLSRAVAADTHTWDGSVSTLWSVAGNWLEGVAPVDGDDLVFPSPAANLINVNNIVGLDVNSITITGDGYQLTGNAITLAATGLATGTVTCCTTITHSIIIAGVTSSR